MDNNRQLHNHHIQNPIENSKKKKTNEIIWIFKHTRIRNKVRILVRNDHNVIGQQHTSKSSSARLNILYIEHGQHQHTTQPLRQEKTRFI